MPPFHILIVRTEILTSQWVVRSLTVQAYDTVRPSWAAVTKEKGVRKGNIRKDTKQKEENEKRRKSVRVGSWVASPTGLTLSMWCIYVHTHHMSCVVLVSGTMHESTQRPVDT